MSSFLILALLGVTTSFAAPTWEEKSRSVVILLADTPDFEQLGSGIIIDKNLILTNEHVLMEAGIADRELIIRNLNGLEFKLSLTRRFTAAHSDYTVQKDIAFAVFYDPHHLAPQTPVRSRKIRPNDTLNLVAQLNGVSMEGQTQTYKIRPTGMIGYCIPVEPGLSGSPVFDSEGYFVALTRGTSQAPKLCGSLPNPGYSLPASLIFSKASSYIPRVRPYLNADHLK